MTTILSIGFGLMTVAVIAELIAFRRQRKQIEEIGASSARVAEIASRHILKDIDRSISLFNKAGVEECAEPAPHFAVFRRGVTEKHNVLTVGFNPNDPEDKEYRRIFAQERADMLNEEP